MIQKIYKLWMKKNATSQEISLNEREAVFIIPRHSEDTQNI